MTGWTLTLNHSITSCLLTVARLCVMSARYQILATQVWEMAEYYEYDPE